MISGSKKVLLKNWKNGFTVPTNTLYPFQWNWDSGFTSLGYAHFNMEYAIKEMDSLFSAQWENGMLPHIVFHSENETTYFPNYDFWDSNVNSGAPQKPKSSGITQPAVHAFILETLLDKFPDDQELLAFSAHIFPKILKCHQWFYKYRDPEREGLTFIFHPWESGRDNSPIWDESLDRIKIKEGELPAYERRDTHVAPSDERPTSYQYDRYVYLLNLGKKFHYDGEGIYKESPFLIQDTLMNAVLIRSNEALIRIGKRLKLDIGEIKEWQSQSIPAYSEKLWNDSLSSYLVYDKRGEKQIEYKEIGGMSALYAGIPSTEKANLLNDYLMDLHNKGYFICPSFDPESPLFDSKRYWRGPIWPQMNWMIHHGLKKYDFNTAADIVKNDLLELIEKLGFYEYFEAQKSTVENLKTGYGGTDFSWTAACALDFIMDNKD